jgi:hypothetical protein
MERCRSRVQPKSHICTLGSVSESVREWTHTLPSGFSTLGVGIPMESQIFKEWFEGSKFIGLKFSLCHWKSLETKMSKMGSHDPFEYLEHKLWPKERSGVKVPIWLLTTRNQELLWNRSVRVACHISLESSWRELQLFFRPHINPRSTQ